MSKKGFKIAPMLIQRKGVKQAKLHPLLTLFLHLLPQYDIVNIFSILQIHIIIPWQLLEYARRFVTPKTLREKMNVRNSMTKV